jgi:hypothetical protein
MNRGTGRNPPLVDRFTSIGNVASPFAFRRQRFEAEAIGLKWVIGLRRALLLLYAMKR